MVGYCPNPPIVLVSSLGYTPYKYSYTYYDSKMWVLGGNDGAYSNDVWHTSAQ